jgi:hypothetical protein
MKREFIISYRVSTIDLGIVNKYQSQLSDYLSNRIIVSDDFALGRICFFFDIHPKQYSDFKPSIKVSAKNNLLIMSMNCFVEDFSLSEESWQGLAFLKLKMDEGLEVHKKRLEKQGLHLAQSTLRKA